MAIRVEHDDMLKAIPRLIAEGVVVDAVVTDPPYHLTSTVNRFGAIGIDDDTKTSKRSRDRSDPAARLARGFMGKVWDGGDIAFRPETWATVATILRPGAFLVAFGGTRTYHRLACAIEDGGFVIQDCLMWLFGTGFPKRRDMLKPAYEPIMLAYKPGGKRTMQIEECKIHGPDTLGGDYTVTRLKSGATLCKTGGNWRPEEGDSLYRGSITPGRWPANVLTDGSNEVRSLFPNSVGQQSDITGEEPSHKKPFAKRHDGKGVFWSPSDGKPCGPTYIDENDRSAARFFYSSKADLDDRWHSRHPTVKPVDLISYLVKLVTPPGGVVLDPFAGSGTTGAAAFESGRNAILIERETEYVKDIHERLAALRGEATRPTPIRPARPRGYGLLDLIDEKE